MSGNARLNLNGLNVVDHGSSNTPTATTAPAPANTTASTPAKTSIWRSGVFWTAVAALAAVAAAVAAFM
ncbi:hypothetical protein ACFVVL_27770 [Kitasatospora sp. NPDC058115]|uniref:hypothetical protein n=1 Tax=Kitasatospora sp. NPDC058115 TaxID=3346347 RepID=UPI0036DC38C2